MKAKKIISTLMAICMLISLGAVSGSANDDTEVEIIICGVDCPVKKQQIINNIFGNPGAIGISPASLTCVFFGHILTEGTGWEITHRVVPNSPRCREVKYKITYCTRSGCNYSVGTVVGDRLIHCCP